MSLLDLCYFKASVFDNTSLCKDCGKKINGLQMYSRSRYLLDVVKFLHFVESTFKAKSNMC